MATVTTTGQDTLRERVANEASKLFMRYGVRSVKMDDIAERLHVSKRTIYEHFRDKDELLMVCIRESLAERRGQREEILNAAPNVIEGIVGVMNHAVAVIQQTNPSLLREIERYHPTVLAVVRQYREENEYRDTVELIQRGIEQGLFLDSIEVDIVTRLLLAQFEVLSNDEVFPPDRYAPADLMRTIIINFIRGIATEKGRRLIDSLLEQNSI